MDGHVRVDAEEAVQDLEVAVDVVSSGSGEEERDVEHMSKVGLGHG